MGARKLGIRGAAGLTQVNRGMPLHFPPQMSGQKVRNLFKGPFQLPTPNLGILKEPDVEILGVGLKTIWISRLFSFRAGFGNYWTVTCQWLLVPIESRELPITSGEVGWALQDLFNSHLWFLCSYNIHREKVIFIQLQKSPILNYSMEKPTSLLWGILCRLFHNSSTNPI